MSILECQSVDGIGKCKNGNALCLMIADHLEWADEHAHLLQLQEKINAYLQYITSGQYTEIYPDMSFEEFLIQVHFKHPPTENATRFIAAVNQQVQQHSIRVARV